MDCWPQFQLSVYRGERPSSQFRDGVQSNTPSSLLQRLLAFCASIATKIRSYPNCSLGTDHIHWPKIPPLPGIEPIPASRSTSSNQYALNRQDHKEIYLRIYLIYQRTIVTYFHCSCYIPNNFPTIPYSGLLDLQPEAGTCNHKLKYSLKLYISLQ